MPRSRPRPRAAAVLAPFAALLLLAAPAAAQDDGLDQTVDPEEETVSGEAVLEEGHVDIGPRFTDGEWRVHGRDDSVSPPVWRPLTDVVTRVLDDAVREAPDDPAFAFLDADPGSEVYVIPQTQAPGVVWLGWNTQDPEVMERADRGVTLTMHGVEGPGHLAVFLQNGDLGAPDVLWDGDEDGPQDLWVDLNTHTHANWVFTEPGVYVVDFEVSADLITGERVSDRAPLRFAVGEETDVDAAFDAEAPRGAPPGEDAAEDPDEDAGEAPAEADADGGGGEEERSAMPVVLAASAAGALVLAAAAVAVTARTRRARRAAEEEAGRAEGPGA